MSYVSELPTYDAIVEEDEDDEAEDLEEMEEGGYAVEGVGFFDCSNWLGWRKAPRGNRTIWKIVCSVSLLASLYFFYWAEIGFFTPLGIMGIVLMVKGLIEIWGQETPTFICPGTFTLFFLTYGLGLPGVFWQYANCTNVDIAFPTSLKYVCQKIVVPFSIMVGEGKLTEGEALTTKCELEFFQWVGIALNIFGSVYSLSYEMHRFWWKAKPENKGKLHTTGLAALSIHPNYFGDLFTYTGWGLVSGTWCTQALPLGSLGILLLLVVPNSDAYLAERYAAEFPSYAEKTATLIPFVHNPVVLRILAWLGIAASVYISIVSCPGACMM